MTTPNDPVSPQPVSEPQTVAIDDLWARLWDDLRHNATGKPSGEAIIAKHRLAIEAEARATAEARIKDLEEAFAPLFSAHGPVFASREWQEAWAKARELIEP